MKEHVFYKYLPKPSTSGREGFSSASNPRGININLHSTYGDIIASYLHVEYPYIGIIPQKGELHSHSASP